MVLIGVVETHGDIGYSSRQLGGRRRRQTMAVLQGNTEARLSYVCIERVICPRFRRSGRHMSLYYCICLMQAPLPGSM
jgi:hypothetical protein